MKVNTKPKLICVGIVTSARGIKGDLRVKSYTEKPKNLGNYGALTDKTGKMIVNIKVKEVKKDHLIIKFSGINDRTEAEKLKGLELFISEDALPKAQNDEFYHSQLIGLHVQLENGNSFGQVSAVQNFGAGDVLEISRPMEKSLLIPFTNELVPIIDIEAGLITLVPSASLLELSDDETSHKVPD